MPSPSIVEQMTAHALAYASIHGLAVQSTDKLTYECAPISLLPNAYPKQAFLKAQTLAVPLNRMVDAVSQDGNFLLQTLQDVQDPFTAKLLQLYQDIHLNADTTMDNQPAKQADRLGIFRSDYMLHQETNNKQYELKQVELNTIASSFAALAVQVASLHRYLVARFESSIQEWLMANKLIVMSSLKTPQLLPNDEGVPFNPALSCIPEAMEMAYERYRQRFVSNNKQPLVILFVVQDGETNTMDQRMLEFKLWQHLHIPVVRRSLTQLDATSRVTSDGALYVTDEMGQDVQVALVYYRAGYAPTDYPSEVQWQVRQRLEQSRATKCPNLGHHLAGTKKVQQALARPHVVERYCHHEDAALIRSAFAGLYSLGSDATAEDLEAVRDVLQNNAAGNYVLKPQREGGGYNYYGQRLADKLEQLVSIQENGSITLQPELSEFILMQRLFPPQQEAILLRSGKLQGQGPSISELGCFGTILASADGEILHNKYAGFLLRTKFANVDEGGVASGFATLSSPYLCSEP
jgi:glutathione synthase